MHTETRTSQLLSVAEAAALLHVDPRIIRSRIRAGLLPARTLTGSRIVRMEREDVLAQLQAVPAKPTSVAIERLSTPEGRARALAALDASTEGDEQEQRETVELLAHAERETPFTLRGAILSETDRFR